MIRHFFIFLFLSSFFFGCGLKGTYINDHIDKDIKKEIEERTTFLINALNTNDTKAVKLLLSDSLKQSSIGSLDTIVNHYFEVAHLNPCHILDEYYTIGTSNGGIVQVTTGENYLVQYQSSKRESYVSLIVSEGKNSQILITCIYEKIGDEWRMNILHFGQYSLFGKTALEWYSDAKDASTQRRYIESMIDMECVRRTIRPADNYMTYFKEQEMHGFVEALVNDGKKRYSFPISISTIESHPQIFNIAPVLIKSEGVFPFISYLTKIELKDTTELKIENEKIQKATYDIFPELHNEHRHIFFRAYNKMGDGKTPVPTYGFEMNKELLLN